MVLRFDSMAPRLIGDYAIKARARTTLGTLVSTAGRLSACGIVPACMRPWLQETLSESIALVQILVGVRE